MSWKSLFGFPWFKKARGAEHRLPGIDEDFDFLIEQLGTPVMNKAVSAATLERFRGKLPNRLLEYWQRYGFCTFSKGLFSIVNPDDYAADLEAWVGDTPIITEDDYYVIARGAFGTLFLWGTRTGHKYEIDPVQSWVIAKEGNQVDITTGDADRTLPWFFSGTNKEDCDVDDVDGNGLFDAAVAKLGSLAADEVFAFEPALIIGGTARLENIAKRNVHVHLSVLAQLGDREILDLQGLMRKAFG